MAFFLGIGNHETTPPKTRADFLIQFADWLDSPVLREQRLKDDPKDHKLHTYYHWVERGIDFINLDNATHDQFDAEQMKLVEALLARDTGDPTIRTVIVGMHAALPDSISSGHSMNEWTEGAASGRRVYQDLLRLGMNRTRRYTCLPATPISLWTGFSTLTTGEPMEGCYPAGSWERQEPYDIPCPRIIRMPRITKNMCTVTCSRRLARRTAA